MNRIPIVQSLYEIAKTERQNGNANSSITPYYYSIDSNNIVHATNTLITAVSENPEYLFCCTVHNYQYYGTRHDAKIYCYLNKEGTIFPRITRQKWSLESLDIFQLSIIDEATFSLINDPSQIFSFKFDSGSPFKSMQTLWDLFIEIDDNCDTVKEAKLYYEYFLKKLEIHDMSLSMDDYREQIANQNDLIIQHESLLGVIKNLVNKS